MVPYLLYRDDDGHDRLFELDARLGRVAIGRRGSCELRLAWDPNISRVHAELLWLAGEWVVSDHETLPRGSFGGRPSGLPDHVELVTGMFQDTLPEFLTTHTDRVAFAHLDCDLYSSAKCVLTSIQERLAIGTVLVFDELFNYDRYFEHEMRALLELGQEGVRWRYVGHVPARCTASLIVTGLGSTSETDDRYAASP